MSPWTLMMIPAGVAVAGGLLAAVWKPQPVTRSLIQHFAAGVILAALAVEVLPEIGREHAHTHVVLGAFAAGCLAMYAMKLWTDRLERGAHHSRHAPAGPLPAAAGEGLLPLTEPAAHAPARAAAVPTARIDWGLLVATFVDVALDGFIIGAGFAAGGETGRVLALGLSVELLFLGLAVASEATAGWRIVAITAGLGATVLSFAWLGLTLLTGASHDVIAGTLAFSAAALLYLVTEELLIEAHEVEESPFATLVLFAGFLSFWAIQLLG